MSKPPVRFGWRIATTEAGLSTGWFFALKLTPPTNAPFHDYSVRVSHSEGGQARHGYNNVRLFWETLSRGQGNTLRTVLQASLDSSSKRVFMTIDRANGTGAGPDWIDISGKVHMPDFDPSQFAGATGIVHQNVELFLNNVTIINDPAIFLDYFPGSTQIVVAGQATLAGSAVTASVV